MPTTNKKTFQERLAEFPVLRVEDGYEVRQNNAHEFYETETFLVLRNHGESFWTAMLKDNGSHKVLEGISGERLWDVVEETRLAIRSLPNLLARLGAAEESLRLYRRDVRDLPSFIPSETRVSAQDHLAVAESQLYQARRALMSALPTEAGT